jgi:hypothetical protein
VCLELAFDAAGTLSVEEDATAFTAGATQPYPRVYRPTSGTTFANVRNDTEPLPDGSASIDIAQPETFQLVFFLVAELNPSGKFRFTLTFHPR